MGWIRGAVIAAFLLAGCVQQASLECGSGNETFQCPSDTTCDEGRHRCLREGELAACDGKPEGAMCTFRDIAGACFNGLCESSTCGDGKLGPGEICDDGNLMSGDGCRGDCRSNETCGNGLIDPNMNPDKNEDCDCGNSDQTMGLGCAAINSLTSDVATCTPDCKYRCGDGMVEPGELCDTVLQEGQDCLEFGYDTGELSCSAVCAPAFAKCEQFGWPPVATGVPDANLNAVWGVDENNVFAVGDVGVILHYDGTSWSKMTTPPALPHLYALWGRSATEVYAAGDHGSLYRYDGSTWSAIPTGYENASTPIVFKGLSGETTNGTDLYLVGGSFPASSVNGIVVRYNGGTITTPVPQGTLPFLTTVVVDRAGAHNQITVAGENGAIYTGSVGGSVWTSRKFTGPDPGNLYGFRYANSALLTGGDVYVVGVKGLFHLAYDATGTTELEAVGTFENLGAVWGTSSTSYFVLGDRAHYFDGTRWLTASEGFVPNAGMWGTSISNVWAVGKGVRHFKGTTWSALPMPPSSSALLAIGTDSPSSTSLLAGNADGDLMRFVTDGVTGAGQWASTVNGSGCPLTIPIESISFGSDIVVALAQDGELAYAPTPDDPFVCDSKTTTNFVYGVYATAGAAKVIAVGGFASIYQRVAGSVNDWAPMTVNFVGTVPDPPPLFHAITGFGANSMFAVADNGFIARCTDGVTWTMDTLGQGTGTLYDVWGTSDQDVFAVGQNGAIVHFNGTSWTKMTSGTINTLEAVWGRSGTDVYAAGGDTLVHYDGTKWLPVRDASLQAIHDLGGTANWLFGVGDSGTIEMLLHY